MKLKEAVQALAALAHESRLEVFRLLVKEGPGGICAGDLSRTLDIPKPTMSFHLKELSSSGLIESERMGRSVKYRLKNEGMRKLMQFLSEDCCQGRPELCLNLDPDDESCSSC
ncbi:metalloregulator ArsR/SmtB family transcription factor [Verrucomicrobiaceae bacterium 227]